MFSKEDETKWLPKFAKENKRLDKIIAKGKCPECGSSLEYTFVQGGVTESSEGKHFLYPYLGCVGCTECDGFYHIVEVYGEDAKNWNPDGSWYVGLKRDVLVKAGLIKNEEKPKKVSKFFKNLKEGDIVALKPGACVNIIGAGYGGANAVIKNKSYMLCTSIDQIDIVKNAYMLYGYFVESNTFGCLKYPNVEIRVCSSDVNTKKGPYEENDMVNMPLFGIYEPMTKKERSEYFKKNKEWLEFNGIHIKDNEENE